MVDPKRVLRWARRRLSDQGILAIYAPNVEYYDIMNPYHPYIYSPETITRLVRWYGFRIVQVNAAPTPTTHLAAVSIVNPNYEIAVFARASERCDVPVPTVDRVRLAASHKLWQETMAWAKLSSTDAVRRIMVRSREKLKRLVSGLAASKKQRSFVE